MHDKREYLDDDRRSGPPDVPDRYVALEHESDLIIADRSATDRWIKSDLALPREETR